ncbi:MAG: HlyD family efflux transporter periplasmic adaptor subunit [Pirellulaceae bacterium]
MTIGTNHSADQSETLLALRADLQQSRIRMGGQDFIVVKDPLARAYFYFSQREWSILELLNGNRSIPELVSACAQRFAPDFVSQDALLHFLTDAKSKGLLHLGPTKIGYRPNPAKPSAKRFNPLAIRMPGINPDAALDSVQPIAAWIAKPLLGAAWCLVVACAAMTVLVHFETFSQHVAIAASHTTVSWWLMIAGVVSVTKIIHELSHAISCKLFGGECRELGVMFLIGVPCLYCDVSDAWMIPQRWKRILISAAGMMAELAIAAIAVFAWRFLDAGVARDLCVSVIVVCSVSTVLFNGNPLLRYDGYFILSDLVGIPNLASQSQQVIRNWTSRVIWGAAPKASSSDDSFFRSLFLTTYGVLSGIYRLLIMFVIASLAHGWMTGHGMTQLANLLAIMVAMAIVIRLAKPLTMSPGVSSKDVGRGKSRRVVLAIGVLVTLGLILMTPIRRHVDAPMMVLPSEAVPVFVSTAGQVVQSVNYHDDVQVGDVIATLANVEPQLELARQIGRKNELQTRLDALNKQQVTDETATAQIPAAADLLASVSQRCELLTHDLDQLVVRAKTSGRLFPPPNQLPLLGPAPEKQIWSGTPLQKSNRGAFLSAGTLVGTIGHPTVREAMMLVDQTDIALVQIGQSIDVLAPSQSRRSIHGTVIEISASPVPSIPDEFYAAGLIEPTFTAAIPVEITPTFYQVRVKLDPSASTLPIRSTSPARVRVKSASLLQRLKLRWNLLE